MRIGEFAAKMHTSIDTIRHYIDLALIVPERQGVYYYFDERCERDYKRVIELKEMGFSLTEIKNILMIIRFSNMSSDMEIDHYQSFFEEKREALLDKRKALNKKIERLEEKIDGLRHKHVEQTRSIAINLAVLQAFTCPQCQKQLTLVQGNIENNQVVSGQLACDCGYRLLIEDGILVDSKAQQLAKTKDESYFIKYLTQNSAEYLNNIYKAMEWAYRTIEDEEMTHQTMVELGVGNGIFLSHIIKVLPSSTTYYAVDYDINRLKYIKKMLEHTNYSAEVVFLCCDFTRIPLKQHSFNFVVDFYGSSSYHFNHSEFLLKQLQSYYADQCGLIAIFMSIERFKKQTLLDQPHKFLFKQAVIEQHLRDIGFVTQLTYEGTYQKATEHDEEIYDLANKIKNLGYYGYIDAPKNKTTLSG